MELLESNNLLAGWSGFEPESTPVQSNSITGGQNPRLLLLDVDAYAFEHGCDWGVRKASLVGFGVVVVVMEVGVDN